MSIPEEASKFAMKGNVVAADVINRPAFGKIEREDAP